MPHPYIITSYLIIINLIGFISMGIDKSKAIHNKYRIPERHLFGIAILGGSIGSWLGMSVFRHKTKHKTFVFGIPFIFAFQVILIIFYYNKYKFFFLSYITPLFSNIQFFL